MNKFEANVNWVATASRNGSLIAIMKTASKDGSFCLYEAEFTFDPMRQSPPGFGPPTYSRKEVEEMFLSQDLLLVKGGLPVADGDDK